MTGIHVLLVFFRRLFNACRLFSNLRVYFFFRSLDFFFLDDLGNDDGTKTLDLTQFYPRENEISVVVDGEKIMFDQPPVSVDGRTMVPIRAVIEEMGGTVEWLPQSSSSLLKLNGNRMILTLNSKTEYYNEEEYELDVEPQAINNRTLLPLRFVAEKFGFSVGWDGDTKTVIIETE